MRFLQKASLQLFQCDSPTSAYLSSEHLALQRSTSAIAKTSRSLPSCRACGAHWISGVTMDLRMIRPKRTKTSLRNKAISQSASSISVWAQCRACHRYQVIQSSIEKPTVIKESRRNEPAPIIQVSDSSEVQEPAKEQPPKRPSLESQVEPKSSGKKRAKVRKDKEGLQALLNRSKPGTSTAKPLDFTDFMKR